MIQEFKLPELGENIQSADIITVLVTPGSKVEKDQSVLEIETDKATIEVPSTISGVVKEVLVKSGDKAKVDQVIFTVDTEASEASAPSTPEPKPVEEEKKTAEKLETAENRESPVTTPQEVKSPQENKSPQEDTKPAGTSRAEAPEIQEFRLPELGENIQSADIIAVLVTPGTKIEKDQSVLEIETDKATIEVPSTISGVVKEVFIKAGDKAKVDQVIFTVETRVSGGSAPSAPGAKPAEAEKKTAEKLEAAEKEETAVTRQEVTQPSEGSRAEAPKAEQKPQKPKVYIEERQLTDPSKLAPAAPTVRRFAREIGVDINQVKGTGPGGRISIPDVKTYARTLSTEKKTAPAASVSGISIAAEALPDFSKWGEVEVKEMSNIRRKTAEHLSYAWATIPHVTQFDRADITDLEQMRKKYGKLAEEKGGKLTVTAMLLKLVSLAMKEFPQFNSSVDMKNSSIIYKKYFSVGVAVDTDRGLLVPVIRDVDKKSIIDLSVELNGIAEKARNKKLTLEDMQGASFTITNLGGIGGTYFTPIVNAPEVAILGVSRASYEQIFKDGKFETRFMLPLSLSYDHRIIDGADGARFLRWIVNNLEQPFLMALQ